MELPAVESPAPQVVQQPQRAPAKEVVSRPLRILLVEDHDATSQVIALLLRRLNHDVTAAPTLAEARRYADNKQFDLLISDLGLPDGSGLDLMRRISRQVQRDGDLPERLRNGSGHQHEPRSRFCQASDQAGRFPKPQGDDRKRHGMSRKVMRLSARD